jgi:GntR family transcriptional regulator/MocR family aminotransferase
VRHEIDRQSVLADRPGLARYERVAAAVEDAIQAGRLQSGERLPAIRQLAAELGVSPATIRAAYELLNQRGLTQGEVGRGTFVIARPGTAVREVAESKRREIGVPWRRRALSAAVERLRAGYPNTLDCTTGRPDPSLFPLDALQRAWREVIETIDPASLQYPSREPEPELERQILAVLAAGRIPTEAVELVVGNSAQQFFALAAEVAGAAHQGNRLVAVEEPGYYSAFDLFERLGWQLAGVEIDRHGAAPDSLERALAPGARLALLTPTAHNPTGASWSPERRAALAKVIAGFPDVIVVEDDFFHFGPAKVASLLADRRIAGRVLHLRSFSKTIAPDLRIAVAAALPPLGRLLAEAKGYADGWTSHLTQRVLATLLADPAFGQRSAAAQEAYAARRVAVGQALAHHAGWTGLPTTQDGLNIWFPLPDGCEASIVVEAAAANGVLVAPGDPFFIRPGRGEAVRINAGSVSVDQADRVALVIAEAVAQAATNRHVQMTV